LTTTTDHRDTPRARRIELGTGWKLDLLDTSDARAGDLQGIDAEVPGSVHTDLLRHGLIPDPFLDENENDVQWIGEADWRYRTTFDLSDADLTADRIDLAFDGLDTLATVTVNGQVVATTENMHRRYRFDLRPVARSGANQLEIVFASAIREAERRRTDWGRLPTASFDQPFNYVRKMACSWGWDWGPKLNTAGIWRPAGIDVWSGARLRGVRPTAMVDESGHGAVAVQVDVDRADEGFDGTITVTLTGPDGTPAARETAPLGSGADGSTISLDAGTVERWWPHTLGDQPLYELTIELADAGGRPVDTATRAVGFRRIEIDTEPDDHGSAFTILVNGVPVFARGLNWIPDDPLVTRVSAERYRHRLEDFRDLGADLVRVWGGGIYESDHFYRSCDELGILVWQDFLFACAAYDEDRLGPEVELEAADNIERLMSHPSLALWNGNNENFMGWFEWGWQEELHGRPWGRSLYLDLLPGLVGQLDPERPYWPGSPYSGTMELAPEADEHGVRHIWDVWNTVDYRRYRDHVPRFVAEFGWQAPPTWPTLNRAISDRPLDHRSPGMLHHQKAADGQGKLERGLAPFFDEPAGTDEWLWATQLNQARAIRTGIEHFRSYRGICMGTVWWQFNDCWPVASWAVLDSDGGRKPGWYALRQAYRSRLLTIQPRGGRLVVAAVNDGDTPWDDTVVVERLDFQGRVMAEERFPIRAEREVSHHVLGSEVGRPDDPAGELIVARTADRRTFWFHDTDRELRLPEPRADLRVEPEGDSLRVTVEASTLLRDLAVFPDRIRPEASIDEQLVTLLPGESATFTVTGLSSGTPELLPHPPVLWTANHLRKSG
jgi:beta-mannosidase